MPEQRVNILIYRPDGTLIAQYLLSDGEHLIGRDINCPVYLDSEHISSNHAKLHLSAEGIYIEDLNSYLGHVSRWGYRTGQAAHQARAGVAGC